MPLLTNVPDKLLTGIESPRNTLGQDVVSAIQGGLERQRKSQQDQQARDTLVQSVQLLMAQQNPQFGESDPEEQRLTAEGIVDVLGSGVSQRDAPFLFPQRREPLESGPGSLEELLGSAGGQEPAEPDGPGVMSRLGGILGNIFRGGGDNVDDLVIEENPDFDKLSKPRGRPTLVGNLLALLGRTGGGSQPEAPPDAGIPTQTTRQGPAAQAGGVQPRGRRILAPDGSVVFLDPQTGNFVDENGQPRFDIDGNPIQ